MKGPNELDFDVAKGSWNRPAVREKGGRSVFSDCLVDCWNGVSISDVHIYQDGEECMDTAVGLAMDKEEFSERFPQLAEEKLDSFLSGYDIESMDSEQLYKLAEKLMEEGVIPEWVGIVNYGVIALIQLEKGWADTADLSIEDALALYDRHLKCAFALMLDKNHDYDEAWRKMRVSSFTDIILQKLWRTKQIEDNQGTTLISEGLDANYKDMINYAAFALIKLTGIE